MSDVAMPRLSDSMEEGTILKWLKSDGDEVTRGEELVEIETDKANMTYEADQDGTLSIVAQEGDTLPVGDTIARIGEGDSGDEARSAEAAGGSDGEQTAEQTDQEPEAAGADREPGRGGEDAAVAADREEEAEAAPAATAEPVASGDGGGDGERTEAPSEPAGAPAGASGANGAGGGRVKASPIARRMAREMGLELSGVQGSGPGGRIVKADVEAAAKGGGAAAPQEATPQEAAPAEAPAPQEDEAPKREVPAPVVSGDAEQHGHGEVTVQELTRLQQTVARRMAESKATAPEFVLNCEVDMEEAVALRKQLKVAAGDAPAPSFNDFVIKAAALALRDFPRANGAYRDGRFELYGRVNVGVAVAAQDALLVPTVFDADRKSLGQIAREARALAERVRAGAITPPELSSGTFSVSNLGMFGISSFTAVINPPQAAILAVGAMEPTPVVVDGEVQVHNRLTLTLSCDHRILYGADAAEFLSRIRERLEQPLLLAL
jgi:pyruvate dehydrogenase E2 component (dihydrolipoamide acetyltransferase)